MAIDWFRTVIQSVPRMGKIVANLRPTYNLPSVLAVTREFLTTHQITAVVWDVDGTIMSYHGQELADPFCAHLRAMFQSDDIGHAILSNCDEHRFAALGDILPDVPLIRGYDLNGQFVSRARRGTQDEMSSDDVDDILARGARQVRKPDGRLIRDALHRLGADVGTGLMVGDQYFTDIAEANLGGVRSAKVPVYDPPSFPIANRGGHQLESVVYRLRYGRRPRRATGPPGA